MSATVVSRHFGCTRKTIESLRRRFRVTGNVADHPQCGRPRVTTAADDRYIVLQHLRNRRLIAAATERQYGIHPQAVRNRLRQNIQPIRAYRPYFGHILTRRHPFSRNSAAITRQFLATNNVNVLNWPANGPDLNPIEQV